MGGEEAGSDASTGSRSSGEGTGETNALACLAPTGGPSLHEGALGMNEVWTADAGPHVVTRFVSVPEGATLTIEPCAEVRMQKDAALVFGRASGTV